MLIFYFSKHLDTHSKPHLCPAPTCTHRAATPRDMNRHVSSHGFVTGSTVYYCPVLDCQHKRGGIPFSRPDNGTRHVKKRHPGMVAKLIMEVYSGESYDL